MNFNLDLKVDKAMNKLSESNALRRWTYTVLVLIIVGVAIWQLAPSITAIATLIEATK